MRVRDATQNIGALTLADGDLAKLWLMVDPDASFSTGTQDAGRMTLQYLFSNLATLVDDAANQMAAQSQTLTISGDSTLSMSATTRMQHVDATFAGGATRVLTLPSANRKAMDVVILDVTLSPAASGELRVADADARVELTVPSPDNAVYSSDHLLTASFMYDRTNDTWRLTGTHYQEL